MVEPRHILAGLWQKPTGATRQLFDSSGVDGAAFGSALELSEIPEHAEPTEDRIGFPGVAPSTAELLRALAAVAPSGEGQVDEKLLLEALLRANVEGMKAVRELTQRKRGSTPPVFLFRRGHRTVEWVQTSEPWELDVEAIALPVDEELRSEAGLIRAWLDAQGEERRKSVETAIARDLPVGQSVVPIVLEPLAESGAPQRVVVVASAFGLGEADDPTRATLRGVRIATLATLEEAEKKGVQSIAIPLFGSGRGALPPRECGVRDRRCDRRR